MQHGTEQGEIWLLGVQCTTLKGVHLLSGLSQKMVRHEVLLSWRLKAGSMRKWDCKRRWEATPEFSQDTAPFGFVDSEAEQQHFQATWVMSLAIIGEQVIAF